MSEVETVEKPDRAAAPQCEFVNSETGQRCKNAGLWVCAASGITDRILCCTTHSKAFEGMVGLSKRKLQPV